jgi:hypothetical protein
MPFGTLVANSITYLPLTPGVYRPASVLLGTPVNDFRVSPAGRPNKDGAVRAAYQRVVEKDVTVGGVTTRELLTVTGSVNCKPGAFTVAEIDGCFSDLNVIVTEDMLNRSLQGEM